MFARQSTIQASPEKAEEGIRYFNETTLPAVRQVSGFLGATMLLDRKTGKTVVTTYWESENALKASEAKANELRRNAASQFKAIGEPIVERFEVASITEIKQPVRARS